MIIKTPNDNTIEIRSSFAGKELIKFNGLEVSSKRTLMGGMHIFQVKECNEEIQYEVELKTRWHGFGYYIIVSRNGKLIFSNK